MAIFPSLLMIHLIGLAMMAGTTLIEFISYQTFWKLLVNQKEQASGILTASVKFSKLIGMGAALLIITGAGMVALTHGVFAQQLWWKIKMFFVVLLIVNGILNGNRLSAKLRMIISSNTDLSTSLLNLKSKLRIFYLAQICIFLIIIFLSAYKFN